MIYEYEETTLRTGKTKPFLDRYGEAYEQHRKQHSAMAGCWSMEFGIINRVVTIWPYANVEERGRIRAEAERAGTWPPAADDSVVAESYSEIYQPFDFSPLLEPGSNGPYYELRRYVVKPGRYGDVLTQFGTALPERRKRSPLAVIMGAQIGVTGRFVHIWPYASLDERQSVRSKAVADGIWPPSRVTPLGEGSPIAVQESLIMLPAAFSPMQ